MMNITLLLLLFTLSFLPAQTIVTARADNWYPYNGDPKSPQPGYVVEILRTILAQEKLTLDYQIMPWTRSISETGGGAIDCVIGALKSDAPKFIFPNEPCGLSLNVFYTTKGKDWKYKGLESLSSVNLGVIASYSYTDNLDAYIQKNKSDPKKITLLNGEEALEQGVLMLQKGRIDVIVEDQNVFTAKMAALKVSKEEVLFAGAEGTAEPVYVAFSPVKPESQKYAALWDKGIQSLRASGELQKILSKYGIPDWKS